MQKNSIVIAIALFKNRQGCGRARRLLLKNARMGTYNTVKLQIMNKIQTNQLRMHKNTQETLDLNSTLWNGIPIFVTTKNEHDELIQRIMHVNEKTNSNSKAVTEDKKKKLEALIEKVMVLAGTLYAFASYNNKARLMGKVNITKSDLINARETDVEKLVRPIISEARKYLPDLVDFMLTEEMVVETETTLDDFMVMIGQPRTIRNQAFAAMTLLDELFDEINDLVKNKLDKLMIRFEATNTEFYSEYKRARTIVD